MKIAYYMPFKPMGHDNPSGDLIIGTELFNYLEGRGVEVQLVSRFRCRWIYLKPYLWPLLFLEVLKVIRHCKKVKPDIWLSYHSYYKAPDILGSLCCRFLDIPYVIFQGIYSTKRRRSLKTVVGFYLNRMVLLSADLVFTNKRPDEKNLKRLLEPDLLNYVAPGVYPHEFQFSEDSRKKLRSMWQVEDRVVILTAAMFRPGVKTEGVTRVIDSCKVLRQKGKDILLVLAGDGANRSMLEELAQGELGDGYIFVGKVERSAMHNYYSAADIFAFPGIEESLGMVFLEAQCCGLPVVAYGNWGASEAVVDGETGLLSPAAQILEFTVNLENLIDNPTRRLKMGQKAAFHVRSHHDIAQNYDTVVSDLYKLAHISHQP